LCLLVALIEGMEQVITRDFRWNARSRGMLPRRSDRDTNR
jgi:hypothetical protein